MKNERLTLSVALLIVAIVLFICVFGFLVSWLDWRLQVGEENPVYRFQTLIAGVAAVLAAGGTIYMMQKQIEDGGRREAQREARFFADEIRTFEAHLTDAQHIIMTNILVTHHFVAKGEPHHAPAEAAFIVRDFPIGKLPKEIRPKATFAINEMRRFGRDLARRSYLVASIQADPTEMLSRYDRCEVALQVTRAAMEGFARSISSSNSRDFVGKVHIADPITDLGLKLRVAAYCDALGINLERDDQTTEQAPLFPLSDSQLPGEV